jgi:hypothetical protein
MSRRQGGRFSPQKQAKRAIIRSALFSPQSATIAVVSIIGFAMEISVLGMLPGVWLILGTVGILAYLWATITDPAAVSSVVSRMFERQYNPMDIRNLRARQRLQQALEYVQNIQRLGQQQGGAMRTQIEATVSEIDDWVEQIYKIARRIDIYEDNTLINRDRARVPNELNVLRQRLENEPDERVKTELEGTVRLKETQLSNLKMLETNIRRADIQLDNTLAALGTIYAQVQLLDSKEVDGRRAHRLRQEIQDEVLSLKDTIEALDDVQATGSYAALSV